MDLINISPVNMREEGLSLHAIGLYAAIMQMGGNASYTQLWRDLRMSSNTLTRIINELIEFGYIYKHEDPNDRRAVIYSIDKHID